MADSKHTPFKVTGGAGTHQSAEEKPAPSPGSAIKQAQATGGPLPTPSDEVLEGRAHGHSPTIPWPPAIAIDEVREAHKDGNAHKVGTTDRRPFKV